MVKAQALEPPRAKDYQRDIVDDRGNALNRGVTREEYEHAKFVQRLRKMLKRLLSSAAKVTKALRGRSRRPHIWPRVH